MNVKILSLCLTALLVLGMVGAVSAKNWNWINDLDGDGLYEDVNGDMTFTFSDIERFHFLLPILNGHPLVAACFDFNGDGRLDFADVITLYLQL